MQSMSRSQLEAWIAYSHLDPFGEDRGDLRAGVIAAAVTNGIRSIAAGMAGKRDFEAVSPIDFMLKFEGNEGGSGERNTSKYEPTEEEKRESWNRMKETLKNEFR